MLGGRQPSRARVAARGTAVQRLAFNGMALGDLPRHPADGGEAGRALPDGAGWQFEPKWDGFRCLAFRDGDEVELSPSRASRSAAISPRWSSRARGCSADALRPRRRADHPDRRDALVRRAADAAPPGGSRGSASSPRETPAQLMLFDLPRSSAGEPLPTRRWPSGARRSRLFIAAAGGPACCSRPAPSTAAMARSAGSTRSRRRARRRRRQAARRALPAGRAGDAQGQAACAPPTASSAASATAATAGRSARCCSASTTRTAGSTMSASPRRSGRRSGRR